MKFIDGLSRRLDVARWRVPTASGSGGVATAPGTSLRPPNRGVDVAPMVPKSLEADAASAPFPVRDSRLSNQDGTPSGERAAPRITGALRIAWFAGCIVFTVQFAGLVVWSWHLWTRFDLTWDMASYSQAWEQIATGHLNPVLTVFPRAYPSWGIPFYQSHFELLMWPLGVLYWIYPHAVDLLFIQDAALAGSCLVAYRWGLEHLQRHWPPYRRGATIVALALLAILAVSPWTYWVASFDFHFHVIGAFFAILAGRDLWLGRRRGWIWAAAALLCGDVATTYVIGLGLAALLMGPRSLRKRGGVLIVASLIWLGVISLLHGDAGSDLSGGYYYLAGHPIGTGISGFAAIAGGIVGHPGRAIHMLSLRHGQIYKYLAGEGTVGVFSPVGFALSLVILVPTALNADPGFITANASFQSYAAVLGLGVGAAMGITWLVRRVRHPDDDRRSVRRRWRSPRWTITSVLACSIAAAAVVQTAIVSDHYLPYARTSFAKVSAGTAEELSLVSAEIPGDAEAVVSQGVVGRFAGRRFVYPFLDVYPNGQTVPINVRNVYFVFVPTQGIELATPAQTEAAIAKMRQLGARVVADRSGVEVLAWKAPLQTREVTFSR